MDRFEEVKERVKEAHDLVSVIEGYIPLRPAGRNFTALCPFHQEKTPSFTVYPDSQHFKCYGCGKAGDVFSFVMEREGLSFRECFEMLAERSGISIEGVFAGPKGPKEASPYAALGEVRTFMHELLNRPEGRRAREYLERRGLGDGVAPFRLGVHPSTSGALRQLAQQRGLPLSALEQAGLLGRDGREPFRGRVMFPIEDERGRVVGFGGRALEQGQPKYINSPESPFFHKRRVLYGLKQAKDAGDRRIVVMEGYTDVIACHLAGFRGAVATLGTALTPDHGSVLTRYARDGVVLFFDGDRAGRAAAEKAYAELARTDLVARIALLPEGMDPADVVTGDPATPGFGRDAFEGLMSGAEDALAMWFRLKRGRLDLTQEVHVAAVVDECAQVLRGIEDPARVEILRGRMARHLGLPEEALRRSLARRKPRSRRPDRGQEPAAPAADRAAETPMEKTEMEILACIMARPDLAAGALDDDLERGRIGVLLDAARCAVADGGSNTDGVVRSMFTRVAETPELAALIGQAVDVASRIREPEETLATLLQHRRAYQAGQAARKIRFELQQATCAGDRERIDELTRRYVTQLREQQFG